jgi:hypothetical protein
MSAYRLPAPQANPARHIAIRNACELRIRASALGLGAADAAFAVVIELRGELLGAVPYVAHVA